MKVSYQPEIIVEFAQGLYQQGNSIIQNYVLTGSLVGAVLGYGLSYQFSLPLWTILIPTGLLAVSGYVQGRSASFSLFLRAQKALCQLRIEENTRPGKQSIALNR